MTSELARMLAQEIAKNAANRVDYCVNVTRYTINPDIKDAIVDVVLKTADCINPNATTMEVLDMLVKIGTFVASSKEERVKILNLVYKHNLELIFPDMID